MKINKREVFRYLGYQNHEPDEMTGQLVDEVIQTLLKTVTPKNITRRFQLTFDGKQGIQFNDRDCSMYLKSNNLTANLQNCEEAVVFAATLGNEPDQLLRKYEITNMSRAAVLQAASAMLIEAYCDEIQETVRQEAAAEGYFLRPRFSPGYGDLPITEQRQFFHVLECEKRMGLTLTDSLMMLPTKSVTAVIGLTREEATCHIGKCKQCSKKDCEFRHE